MSAVAGSAGAGGTTRSERRVPLWNLTNVVGGRTRAAKAEVCAVWLVAGFWGGYVARLISSAVRLFGFSFVEGNRV